ncbi:MAG TPA: HDIG domain-containing protein [Roseiflexaceae bacterium]|nr:HDIG domain-containing protein [Roseiflexaceae bacterium]
MRRQPGRRDVRAPLSPAERVRSQRRHLLLVTLVLAAALWVLLAVRPPTIPGLRLGFPSPASIQSPRPVSYVSDLLTEQERARAESAAETIVYQSDPAVPTQQRIQLDGLLQTISQIRTDPSLASDARLEKITTLPNSTIVISRELATQLATLSDAQWQDTRRTALLLYDRSMERYSYELSDSAVGELRERSLPYWSAQELRGVERELALHFSSAFLKANRVLDEEATAQRKQAARAAVRPVTVTLLEGQSIVRQGDPITPEVEERLAAIGMLQTETDWLRVLSGGLLALLFAGTFGVYLALAQRAIWMEDRPLLLVCGLFGLTVLAARLVLPLIDDWPYAFPLGMTALLLAALFGRGVALVAAGLISLLIAYLSQGQFSVNAALLLGSTAGVFVIGRPERSLTFLFAGVAIALTTALTQTALVLPELNAARVTDLGELLLFCGMNGALSAILALGLYNLAGHLAGIATPFQLMELAHPAQPLLRKLMREAPGTYYHSIAVGNLAESAAEAIGADSLLLRVAAYYHDIGKSIRPYFFTDNQSDRENVHNDLDPQTSAEIIAEHVREGVNMARAAGLPQQLIEFIPTHHGTSVIRHFYQQALQREDTVDIAAFSYPGPKPQTREQAILMLSDTVEATVRSKAQHGKLLSARQAGGGNGNGMQTLEELVTSIIDERVRSGQLDESQLTLQDLARIRAAFINTLQGIYHPRVEYAPQIVKSDRFSG